MTTHPFSWLVCEIFVFMQTSVVSSRKGERQKREVGSDCWVPTSRSTRHWLLVAQWSATTLNTHSLEWCWAAFSLAYYPSQTTSRQNAFQDNFNSTWILKHLEHFSSLKKIVLIIKELLHYSDKLNQTCLIHIIFIYFLLCNNSTRPATQGHHKGSRCSVSCGVLSLQWRKKQRLRRY